jgi:hypothetical protein
MSRSHLSKRAAVGVGAAAAAIASPIALAQPAGAATQTASTQTVEPWTIIDSNGVAHDCVVQMRFNATGPNSFEVEVNSLGDATCRQSAAYADVQYQKTDGTFVDTGYVTDGFATVQRAYTDSAQFLTWYAHVEYKAPCQGDTCSGPFYQGPK